jgi:Ca2+-binding EF-hand superfamily protein
MKKLLTLSLVAALGATTYAYAQDFPRHHGKGPGHRFEMLDGDHNGQVTLEEMRASKEKHWLEADANKDGVVTQEEIAALFERKGAERFAEQDKNKDGVLSRDEVQRMPQEIFEKIDANKDGNLSQSELIAMHGKKHDGKGGPFADIDANGDGKITKAESEAFVGERFKELDLNGDGAITRDEMREANHHRGGPFEHNEHNK